MRTPDDTESLLHRAEEEPSEWLSDRERDEIREILEAWEAWKAYGKLGKFVLWVIISIGAATAAIREIVSGTPFSG